ncbi:MAG: hypothetical protein KAI47_05025 [Deltaproteobacteria bacterium]|nr:hypothetical protein [Deltaproteobacteria bacterium]
MNPIQNNSHTTSVDQYIASLAKSANSTDIAFMVFQEQVKGLNQQVTDSLQNVQTSGRIRDAYSKKLAALRDMKTLAAEIRKGGKENVTAEELFNQFCKDAGKGNIKMGEHSPEGKAMWAEFSEKFDVALSEPRLDDKGNVIMERDGQQKMMSVSGDELQSRIDTVKDSVRQIDSKREIGMIMLNTWMNKKGNAISQLTNLIKAQHDTEKSVINRMGV